ncbi:MAG: DNA-processing protein DprA [Oscillospiraceae bacterium]|jgi:DNA processing protein|nr:DNA-processing protein DprA [Oscillospiraceae bacterium]
MTEYYLWLLQFMGAANPRSVQLIRHYGSAQAVYEAFSKAGNDVKFLKPGEAEALKTASLEKSREIMQIGESYNYRAITLEDEQYPVALKNIYNPPIMIFAAGELPCEELCIAVIGTREACDYSFKVTKRLCSQLAREGVTIVSGMAIGIDKTAHTAAVEVRGRTVGVLACGFAVDYPKYSTPFRHEIVKAGGAIVTELLPYSRGERGYFIYRNRIMSGLSRGVILIEAADKSGCHITANHATSQNRDIFCVPPADIFHPRFRGVIGYLRDGAIPVFDHSDVLNEYFIRPTVEVDKGNDTGSDVLIETQAETVTVEAGDAPKTAAAKPFNVIPEKPPEPDLSELSGKALEIAELLKDGVKTVDFLAEKSGLTADELSEVLLELEIDGVIESAAGSSYRLCAT